MPPRERRVGHAGRGLRCVHPGHKALPEPARGVTSRVAGAVLSGPLSRCKMRPMPPPVTPADTARHLQQRAQARRRAGAARAARLSVLLPGAAALLRDRYSVTRVVLFGSVATGACTAESDLDLAVEGLPSATYFAALADLMELTGGPVDLVRLEEAPASLAERIAAEGRAL